MGQTYIERTTAAIEALESALRTHFKAEEPRAITFTYNGATYDVRDRETRMLLVAAIQDAYYREHGEYNQRKLDEWYAEQADGSRNKARQRPSPVKADSTLMDRLTDAVLYEEITDPNPHKIAHTEYPFMSERQLDLRRDRETSDTAAEAHGVDGRDHRTPTKRARTPYERRMVDAGAKIRNAARAARYKRDTAPGRVVAYNLRDTCGELTEPFTQKAGIGARWLADMSAVNDVTVESADEYAREAA
ncbi:hypothetical protein MHB77_32335 [Paenibacillus sp. FSL K6-3166]|uniref:hypothetical protein n=1 Tax=unclassified Paenibacillus TaxID=185978 RepID=UPI000BA14720|nr:hypothetical protein [Paenibacillus sp. VTT E-133291]OZQ84705.1 hypothetical protein CA598_23210 [Paenibacillus sp. VTT E-133291]